MDLIKRRAFTSVQPRTTQEKNHHPCPIVKHNSLLYKRARDMASRVVQATKQASREATIFLYAPVLDRHMEPMAELADRVFCFCDMQEVELSQRRGISEELASQTTWEAFS
jgi:hypothetical protein